jgi:hypothetical protein
MRWLFGSPDERLGHDRQSMRRSQPTAGRWVRTLSLRLARKKAMRVSPKLSVRKRSSVVYWSDWLRHANLADYGSVSYRLSSGDYS